MTNAVGFIKSIRELRARNNLLIACMWAYNRVINCVKASSHIHY